MEIKHVTFTFTICRQFNFIFSVLIEKVNFLFAKKIESSNFSLGLKLCRAIRLHVIRHRHRDIKRHFYLFRESVINHVRVRRLLSRLRSFLRFRGACYRFVNLNAPTLYIPVLHPRPFVPLFSIFSIRLQTPGIFSGL